MCTLSLMRKANAIISCASFDNRRGEVSSFRQELSEAVQAVSGEPFKIFQRADDLNSIVSNDMLEEIPNELHGKTCFYFPILTPSFFKCAPRRKELSRFLELASRPESGIFVVPIYWITCPELEDEASCADDALMDAFRKHRRWDWRELRRQGVTEPAVIQSVEALAIQISQARRNIAHAVPRRERLYSRAYAAQSRGTQQTINKTSDLAANVPLDRKEEYNSKTAVIESRDVDNESVRKEKCDDSSFEENYDKSNQIENLEKSKIIINKQEKNNEDLEKKAVDQSQKTDKKVKMRSDNLSFKLKKLSNWPYFSVTIGFASMLLLASLYWLPLGANRVPLTFVIAVGVAATIFVYSMNPRRYYRRWLSFLFPIGPLHASGISIDLFNSGENATSWLIWNSEPNTAFIIGWIVIIIVLIFADHFQQSSNQNE